MIFDPIFLIITVVAFGASALAGQMLQRRFREYSQIPMALSGSEVAEKMLHDNGIYDVQVISVAGQLTDHYNPMDKTVNLSEVVYHQRNVAAAAVAAHECGHAIQHATAYSFLKMRSQLVPIVSVSSQWMQWVLLAGLILAGMKIAIGSTILLVGILMFGATTLFSFVTLPVEFDASRRALVWLDRSGITNTMQHQKAKSALWWAATTYVVAALASLAQLIYWVMQYMSTRD